MVRYMTM